MKKLFAALLLFALSPLALASVEGSSSTNPLVFNCTLTQCPNNAFSIGGAAVNYTNVHFGCPGGASTCGLFFGAGKTFEVGDLVYTEVYVADNVQCRNHHWRVTLQITAIYENPGPSGVQVLYNPIVGTVHAPAPGLQVCSHVNHGCQQEGGGQIH